MEALGSSCHSAGRCGRPHELTLLAVIIAVVVVIAVAAVAASMFTRRQKLRERFGPEYERTMGDAGSRMAGERELRAREKRHDALDIKPLDSTIRDRYTRDWASAQEEFVDRPEDAVHDADRLVTSLMHERGYPTQDFGERAGSSGAAVAWGGATATTPAAVSNKAARDAHRHPLHPGDLLRTTKSPL
ncbi:MULTISPECIES: hypothetical protein [Streptomyces]|uniref:Secreted protein n=1 Tax=Streptomyces mirabilis TaxID=68239 RepID=A0ABU3UC00_9ACTN|nr:MULTISPECIES: hypothetical protein [Streptomyces]MCX4617077.1 hypothetical protein [Streptomyces mirabilis]MDU8991119.1 hypothetical protein [Streptomyces mirabilis]